MSTTDPTTTTENAQGTSSPSPSSSSSQSDSGTATLYLFTFLATILILILLSASLLLRSYILRRRYRRHLQQTLTDAVFVDFNRGALAGQFDPLGLRRPTRRFGPKPVLSDTWIHPVDDDAWPSFMPVAVRCTISSLPTSSQPSPPAALSPPQSQSSFFSRFRLFSPRLSSRRRAQSSIAEPPALPGAPPSIPMSPCSSAQTEKEDTTTLTVCMLVAMPDPSAPLHRPVPDAKGKGVDPLESQAQSDHDADPLILSSLPPPLHRQGARLSDVALGNEGPPLLEFGVVEVETDAWR